MVGLDPLSLYTPQFSLPPEPVAVTLVMVGLAFVLKTPMFSDSPMASAVMWVSRGEAELLKTATLQFVPVLVTVRNLNSASSAPATVPCQQEGSEYPLVMRVLSSPEPCMSTCSFI